MCTVEAHASDRVTAIGEAKWHGEPVGVGQLQRLEHIRALLPPRRAPEPPRLLWPAECHVCSDGPIIVLDAALPRMPLHPGTHRRASAYLRDLGWAHQRQRTLHLPGVHHRPVGIVAADKAWESLDNVVRNC